MAPKESSFLPGRVIVADQLPKSDPQKKALMNYVNKYSEKYKVEGDHFGGHAYDAVMLLKERYGTREDSLPRRFVISWRKRKNSPVSAEPSAYSPQDHAGLTSDAFVLVQVEKGDWKLIK